MKIPKSIFLVLIILLFFKTNYSQERKDKVQTIITLNDSCKLLLKISLFEPSMNKIEKCKVLNWEGVCLINNELVFGTDFEVPNTALDKIDFYLNDHKIQLDASCMFNPNGLNLIPNKNQFNIQGTEGGIILTGTFSDGAGAYSAKWKIVKNRSLRVFLGETDSY